MFREAGIECRASHSGGGSSSSSTGRGSRGGTFTGPTAAASAATTAVAAALSLSLALSFVRLATEFSLLSDTGPCWDIYKNFWRFRRRKSCRRRWLTTPRRFYFFYLIPSRLPVVCSRATWLILPVAYACLKD